MRKRLVNTAFVYGMLGLFAGAFYREFTKFINFNGETTLAKVHTHVLTLGMLMFLIVSAISLSVNLKDSKYFMRFYCTYNTGVIVTTGMLFLRGMQEVLNLTSSTLDICISIFAGVGHIVLTIGAVFLFLMLKDVVKDN